MSIDCSTTSERCMIFEHQRISKRFRKGIQADISASRLVEQIPAIYETLLFVCRDALTKAGIGVEDISAIGTQINAKLLLSGTDTGRPHECHSLAMPPHSIGSREETEGIRERSLKTGLVPDAYFSSTKLKWIPK